MTGDNSERKKIEAVVTALAKKCHSFAKLALSVTQEDFTPDQLDDRGRLVFLSIMSQSIAQTISEQRGSILRFETGSNVPNVQMTDSSLV